MFTNGVNHFCEHVANSEVDTQFYIEGIRLCTQNESLVAIYKPAKNDKKFTPAFVRTFKRNLQTNNFEMYEDPQFQARRRIGNISFDTDKQIYDYGVVMMDLEKSAGQNPKKFIKVEEEERSIRIHIPKGVFREDLFDEGNVFEKIIQSKD